MMQDKIGGFAAKGEDVTGECILCAQPAKLQPLDWDDWDRCSRG